MDSRKAGSPTLSQSRGHRVATPQVIDNPRTEYVAAGYSATCRLMSGACMPNGISVSKCTEYPCEDITSPSSYSAGQHSSRHQLRPRGFFSWH
jgi:hypothetical protein